MRSTECEYEGCVRSIMIVRYVFVEAKQGVGMCERYCTIVASENVVLMQGGVGDAFLQHESSSSSQALEDAGVPRQQFCTTVRSIYLMCVYLTKGSITTCSLESSKY